MAQEQLCWRCADRKVSASYRVAQSLLWGDDDIPF